MRPSLGAVLVVIGVVMMAVGAMNVGNEDLMSIGAVGLIVAGAMAHVISQDTGPSS
jgi:hypothetical protein